VILGPIAGQFTTPGKEDKIIRAVPMLNHVKAFMRDREKPGAERIAILGLGPGDYRGACLLRQVETMF
jgi:hypothetical protein